MLLQGCKAKKESRNLVILHRRLVIGNWSRDVHIRPVNAMSLSNYSFHSMKNFIQILFIITRVAIGLLPWSGSMFAQCSGANMLFNWSFELENCTSGCTTIGQWSYTQSSQAGNVIIRRPPPMMQAAYDSIQLLHMYTGSGISPNSFRSVISQNHLAQPGCPYYGEVQLRWPTYPPGFGWQPGTYGRINLYFLNNIGQVLTSIYGDSLWMPTNSSWRTCTVSGIAPMGTFIVKLEVELVKPNVMGQSVMQADAVILCQGTLLPTAVFTSTTTPNSLTINFSGPPIAAGVSSWAWTFGDGDTSTVQNPMHTYATQGSYQVCLTTTNCVGSATYCDTIEIVCPAPVANFTSTATWLNASFTNASSGTAGAYWHWDFGDGSTDTLQHPTHGYSSSGTYNVCLTVQDSCGVDTLCAAITVYCQPPQAGFSHLDSGLTLTFIDTSSSATAWLWDFGDGSTDTLQHPQHTYAFPGTYQVCLAVSDVCGTDTICDTILVSCPPPTSNFSVSATNLTASFLDASTGAPTAWQWNFGDGTTSTSQNPSHTYSAPGTYTVCLVVGNLCGVSDTTCVSIQVVCPSLVAAFMDSLSGFTAYFTNTSIGMASTWIWNFGDGYLSNLQNPTHSYAAPGTYSVCLIASDGCSSDTLCDTIVIQCPLPQSAFFYLVNGLTVTFTDSSAGATTWHWDFGDSSTASLQNPIFTYAAADTYWVCLITANSCGQDTLCDSVEVLLPVRIDEWPSSGEIQVFPIPTTGEIHVQYQFPLETDMEVTLVNALGQRLFSEQWLRLTEGTCTVQVAEGLTAMNFLHLITSVGGSRTIKIIRQ